VPAEEDPRLIRILEAIADGSPVDWSEAADVVSPVTDPLRELRVIAQLAAVHRQLIEKDSAQSLGDVLSVLPAASVQPDRSKGVPWGPLLVLDEIGGGSFGKVYRAWDPSLDHEVALKRLRLPARAPASQAASIVREGQLLARVRHQNVITVHGACEINGEVGIWMDFVRGKTLEQIVRDEGPMSAQEASVVGESLCRALAAIHQAGLLHRDIKASNVMREAGGRIVVLDLGASTEMDIESPTGTRRLAGTPLYMAPELFEGGTASVPSDIYSLGVLLFYLATGRYPVEGNSLVDIRAAHQLSRRVLLSDVRSDLPRHFVEAIERALSGLPEHRCQSAGAMLRSLSAGTSTDPLSPHKEQQPPVAEFGGIANVPASELRGRLLLAKTSADLRRLKYELEGYLSMRPHDVDGRILRDEIDRAIGLDVLAVDDLSRAGRHQETTAGRPRRSYYRRAAFAAVAVAVLWGGLWLRPGTLRAPASQPVGPTSSAPSPKGSPSASVPTPVSATTPSAPPARGLSSGDEKRLESLRRLVRRQYARGERQQALASATTGLLLSPQDVEIRNFLDQALKDARSEAGAARSAALAAIPADRRSTTFQDAERRLQGARLAEPGAPLEAIPSYWSATALFGKAVAEAKNAPRPVVTIPPSSPGPDVGPAPTPDPVAVPTQQQPVVVLPPTPTAPNQPSVPPVGRQSLPTPTPVPTPPAPAPPVRPAEEPAIMALIAAYADAYSHLDVTAVRRAYPQADAEKLKKAFDDLKSQKVQTQGEQIQINGTTATVTLTWQAAWVGKVGVPGSAAQRVELTLQKSGTAWIIVGRR
jgi:serine/threonine protein kinase